MPDKMEPEPAVEYEGTVSDWSEHAPMLANPEANALADEMAINQARDLGFTEDQIDSLLRGPEATIPPPEASISQQKSTASVDGKNVGRIAERIVANELEACGFLVRDLNLEGIAPNADLLAVKDQNVWLVQVKGSTYGGDWWFQYGYCTVEHIRDSSATMFNRAKGAFKTNVVALVCVRSPFEYQCIFLPVHKAEEAAQINLNYAYRTKKTDGSEKKPHKVWFTLYSPGPRTKLQPDEIRREQELLKPYLLDRSHEDAPNHRVERERRLIDERHVYELINGVFSAALPST